MSHTPGPFQRAIMDHGDVKQGEAIVAPSVRGKKDPFIVVQPGAIWGRSLAECDANAKLFAAAPELLEACQWFVSQFEGESGAGANYWLEHAEFRNAKTAIAKAKGC